MKLTVDRTELSRVLAIAARAMPSRTVLPILRTFELWAGDGIGRLRVGATDLERYVRVLAQANVVAEGAVCVGPQFAEFVSHLAGGQVDIELSKDRLTVRCGRETARFPTMPAEEFPTWPNETERLWAMDGEMFARLVKKVAFASATDESRPVLCGVNMQIADGKLTLAAADGFRLAAVTTDAPVDREWQAVIPAKSLSMLAQFHARMLSIGQRAASDASQVIFMGDEIALATQLILGKFPDVDQVIPTTYDTQGRVKREELLHAARLMRVFAREARNALKLDVGPEQFVVASEVSEAGDGHSVVDAEFAGKPVQLAVNADYLIDALAALDCEFVVLRFINSKCPLVIRPDRDEDCVAVIMPMNLQEGQCRKT